MEAPQKHVDTQVNEVCRAYTCEGRHQNLLEWFIWLE
jgi:hypothetical protein